MSFCVSSFLIGIIVHTESMFSKFNKVYSPIRESGYRMSGGLQFSANFFGKKITFYKDIVSIKLKV